MGKKRPSRRFNLRKVRVTPARTLLTLASVTVTEITVHAVAAGAVRIISAKLAWSLTDLTANDGPIIVGFAHSDYTVTEIKECIEASTAIDLGDKVAQERANRLVRIVGTMNDVRDDLNDGEPISTKLNWRFNPGETLMMWCYNDGAALLTTGASVEASGNLWVKDV